jgi:hypothetical protein
VRGRTRLKIKSNRIESKRVESNRTESNRFESNRIESNRIETNRIESNRIESNRTAPLTKEMFFAAWAVPEKVKIGKGKDDLKFAGVLELECVATEFSFQFHFKSGGSQKCEKISVTVWTLQLPELVKDPDDDDSALLLSHKKISHMVAAPRKATTVAVAVATTAESKAAKAAAASETEAKKSLTKGPVKHLLL